jgi:hypothetical protein
MGPKLSVVRRKVPSEASKVYVNPPAGEGSGTEVSWLARAVLNCVKLDWNALLKWPECVSPVGRRASLSTTRPVGPKRCGTTRPSFSLV